MDDPSLDISSGSNGIRARAKALDAVPGVLVVECNAVMTQEVAIWVYSWCTAGSAGHQLPPEQRQEGGPVGICHSAMHCACNHTSNLFPVGWRFGSWGPPLGTALGAVHEGMVPCVMRVSGVLTHLPTGKRRTALVQTL